MNNILVAKNITYKYFAESKKNILENAAISLKEGSVTLLTGKSGCGKSTLAYILAGLYPENGGVLVSGEVSIAGVNIHALPPSKRVAYVSMMFQNCDLQFCMHNLYQELLLCLENIGVAKEDMADEVEQAVGLLGLDELLHREFNTLSGGEKQKCALCCILVLKSKCIILDEAFANVDDSAAKEIIQLLCKTDRTILAIDHNIALWEGTYTERINLDDTLAINHRVEISNSKQTEGGEYVSALKCTRAGYTGVHAGHSAIPLKKVELNVQSNEPMSNCGCSRRFLLQTKGLTIQGINYPDMDFHKGSITAILGASGCGKTTFFKTLIKQHKYNGSIQMEGRELSQIRKRELFSRCGIVFQNPGNQFLSLSVFDEIFFSVKKWNKHRGECWQRERTMELLESFDLVSYKKYSPYMLSQGQQRRLAVLSMLAGEQQILLLDEPTYGQDYENIYTIMDLLRAKANQGLTILFNTHNERVAMDFSNQIIRLT